MTSSGTLSPFATIEGDLGRNCTVRPFVVVERGATVGDLCVLHPHVVVGADAKIGDGCVLHPHATIGENVILGAGVEILHSAVLGREPKGAGATARTPEFIRKLRVGDGCSIGAHATIYYDVEIGTQTLIGDSASIREGGRIGARCIVSRCVTLNYDVQIGDEVKVMDNTHLTGGTRIADGAFVSTMVATANDNRPTADLSNRTLGAPQIEAGATVGAGAILLPGVVIGRGAVVGAGAVVTRDVAPEETVIGLPARAQTAKGSS
jgi:UDP-3-O-[3-hydroxymyristoyl] glucosamine N-acyltransferase